MILLTDARTYQSVPGVRLNPRMPAKLSLRSPLRTYQHESASVRVIRADEDGFVELHRFWRKHRWAGVMEHSAKVPHSPDRRQKQVFAVVAASTGPQFCMEFRYA